MLGIATVVGLVLSVVSQDPLFIYNRPAKQKNIRLIVEYADKNNHDPYELLGIATVESNFNPKAVSSAGAVGLFQVMCKFWYKKTGYKTIASCNKGLLNPKPNIKAGHQILTTIRRKYKQCAGTLAYRCYFAGARWNTKYKPGGKTARKIIRYENKVKRSVELFHTYYSRLIENIRSDIKTRS